MTKALILLGMALIFPRRALIFQRSAFICLIFPLWRSGGLDSANSANRCADQSLRLDDGRAHVRIFSGKSILCYIHGHNKQYIPADTIFNYIVGFPLI